jgi:predicted nucleotidyltransferase
VDGAAGLPLSRENRQYEGMDSVKADETVLSEVVRRLVEALDPDRVILFGSRARGDHRPDSDVDLLIVRDSTEPRHRRVIRAYRALRGLGIPKDILWYTPQEVADWVGVVNHVICRALNDGLALYEKRP